MTDLVRVRRALLSVTDKSGLVEFARALASHGVEILSTGGTASALRQAGLAIRLVEDATGFPEILSGRVKTLHPKVHGGLLARRGDAGHAAQMAAHAIEPIDLLCVNLYAFEHAAARPDASRDEVVEQIDIGGPAMIRSAAKNHEGVVVVTDPGQYARVAAELAERGGCTSLALRAELAAAAFARTCAYDAAIASFLASGSGAGPSDGALPGTIAQVLVKAQGLRYGENPHQGAALYRAGADGSGTIPGAEQLHGKELGYNNILDAAAALDLAWDLARAGGTAAVVVKHTNPCGAAVAGGARDAVELALAGDPVAAYGGILATSATLDEDAARLLGDKSVFLEVIVAPGYTPGALEILRARSAGLRVLACGMGAGGGGAGGDPRLARGGRAGVEVRAIPGGVLVQDRDARRATREEFAHRAGPKPDPAMIREAMALECVARALLSNAVVIGGAPAGASGAVAMFGAGAGQMDRVTSCRLAVEKAGARARGAVACSDAFFPFADGPSILIDAGVRAIVHPGGSKRDQETFDLCERRGVACLTTGLRHFRH